MVLTSKCQIGTVWSRTSQKDPLILWLGTNNAAFVEPCSDHRSRYLHTKCKCQPFQHTDENGADILACLAARMRTNKMSLSDIFHLWKAPPNTHTHFNPPQHYIICTAIMMWCYWLHSLSVNVTQCEVLPVSNCDGKNIFGASFGANWEHVHVFLIDPFITEENLVISCENSLQFSARWRLTQDAAQKAADNLLRGSDVTTFI